MAPKYTKRPFNIAFGNALKGYRMLYGYPRAEDFAAKVEEVTGIKFPLDTLRRIESGRQAATVEQYAAICITINGNAPGMLLQTTLGAMDGDLHDAYIRGVEWDRISVEAN